MAYVPKDRDGEAMMMKTTIMRNFVLPSIEDVAGKAGFLNYAQLKKMAEETEDLSI